MGGLPQIKIRVEKTGEGGLLNTKVKGGDFNLFSRPGVSGGRKEILADN